MSRSENSIRSLFNQVLPFFQWIWKKTDFFFPEVNIFFRTFPLPTQILIWVILFVLFSVPTHFFLQPGGLIGFDWLHFFGIHRIPPFYPPWDAILLYPITWDMLVGITLASLGLAALKRAVHPISLLMTFLSLPLLWTVFLGQIEGVILLGIIGLPWLAPLALLKPQVSIFAFGARRRYIIGFFIFILISIMIWGPWYNQMFAVETFYAEGRYPQNIGIGWWGVPITLILLWFSRGDMDMLMAAGVWMVPHLIPYNLLPFTPGIARLHPWAACIAMILSWLPFSANWLGPSGWWLGWLYVAWVWGNLAYQRYQKAFNSILNQVAQPQPEFYMQRTNR